MSLRDKLSPEEVAAAQQRYALNRAVEVIEHVLSRYGEHGTYLDTARALDAKGLLATPAHDAAVAAKAWREGFTTGQSRAMRHMSDEPLLPLSAPNPYEREAGESDADA